MYISNRIRQHNRILQTFGMLALLVFISSCANMNEYTPESFRNNIDYKLHSLTIKSRAFTFSSDISGDDLTPTQLHISTKDLVRAALAGDPKRALHPMQLEVKVNIANQNNVSARVHAVTSQVWLNSKLLTTLANDEERDILANTSDTYTFSFPIPESVAVTKVLMADRLQIKGNIEASVLVENIPVPASKGRVQFSHSYDLPLGILRDRLQKSGMEL